MLCISQVAAVPWAENCWYLNYSLLQTCIVIVECCNSKFIINKFNVLAELMGHHYRAKACHPRRQVSSQHKKSGLSVRI